jgi:Mn2+/Fe2+ NRAMP family transporter
VVPTSRAPSRGWRTSPPPEIPCRNSSTLVAIVGTVVSPYIFFWQSSVEVEEEKAAGRHRLWQRRGARRIEMRYSATDINVGVAVTNAVMYFIILSTAMTLHASGPGRIRSGADAARAFEPVAGHMAGLLFAAGMIGTGLLSVPILSMSSAYALAEAFKWPHGLDARWREAKGFYGVIVVGTLAGAATTLSGVNAIAALFWSSVLNGVIAPPLLGLILVLARSEAVMGTRRIGRGLAALGWVTVLGLTASVAALAWSAAR